MEFDNKLVQTLLEFIRDHSRDFGSQISFQYQEVPGQNSNAKIAFHLEYCRNEGYITGSLSADKIMAIVQLTPSGLQYLQRN